MRYYLIAGEASGDIHGANLMKALQKKDVLAQFRCWGGDLMRFAGGELVKHYRDLAFMGFAEVVKNLATILNNFKICKKDILKFKPDVLVLIDYPGFNLRMAKWAKQRGIRVFYYISPQIWAWHTSRVHQIKRNIDRMFVILPFEKPFYQQFNYEVDYIGHPLLDHLANYIPNDHFSAHHQLTDRPIIALLPGSRRQEISKMLSVMLQLISVYTDYQFVIAGAPAVPVEVYQNIIKDSGIPSSLYPVVIENDTYGLLSHSYAALVTSGTATLEAALFNVPQVVCYTGNGLSYQLAKRLVKIPYISLVNLVLDRPAVTELIQTNFTKEHLKKELDRILNPDHRKMMQKDYGDSRRVLGAGGASERAADLMIGYLNNNDPT